MTGTFEPEELEDKDARFMPSGSELRFYNDEQMYMSAKKISAQLERDGIIVGVLRAFENIRPGAYRADLWRLLQLWDTGGIYMDSKLVLQGDLSALVDFERNEFVICQDEPSSTPTRPLFWNGLMAAAPRHPTILSAIRLIVEHAQNHYYGPANGTAFHDDLYITGPGVISEAMTITRATSNEHCVFTHNPHWYMRKIDGISFKANIHLLPSTKLIAVSSAKVHSEQQACKNCLFYPKAVADHEVYCDEAGPPCPRYNTGFLQARGGGEYSSTTFD